MAKTHPGVNPVQPHYRGAQGVLGLKTAVEKAMAANGGKKPTTEELAAAMVGIEWDAPSGHIKMALGDGHQAIQSNAAGRTKWDADAKMVKLVDIVRFPAECVNLAGRDESRGLDWSRLPRRPVQMNGGDLRIGCCGNVTCFGCSPFPRDDA